MRVMVFLTAALTAIMLSAPISHAWPKGQAEAGAASHPKLLAQYGGEIENAYLTAYVQDVAKRIIRRTPYAKEKWVISVVDSPMVNAFATQGGYIYVTRGLLALANTEAELAGVLAHEIAHVTENHVRKRQKKNERAGLGVLLGAVVGGLADGKDGLKKGIELGSKLAGGYIGQYSQSQEFDADKVGQRFMIAAGYDPMGSADFLASMAAKHALEAEIAGKEYNPNQVSIFASHPATGDRVRKAQNLASSIELRELLRIGEDSFMDAIDGMIYGDSAAQGFVRGNSFIHPVLRFQYSVPPQFTIMNSARAVASLGPNGATLKLESGGEANTDPATYIRRTWAPALAKNSKTGKLQDLRSMTIDGLPAAQAILPFTRKGQQWVSVLILIEHNNRFFRFTGAAPASDRQTIQEMANALRSFRALSEREARRYQPWRLRTHRVRSGDTVSRLTRSMPDMARAQDRFVAMNGLGNGNLISGDLVKVIEE